MLRALGWEANNRVSIKIGNHNEVRIINLDIEEEKDGFRRKGFFE